MYIVSVKVSPTTVPLDPILTIPVDSSMEKGELEVCILKVLVLVMVSIYSELGKSPRVSPLENVVI